MILASNKTNKQKKVQTRNHHTTEKKNKTKLCIPNSLQKENTEIIYERVLSAGAKFRIFSTLCTLQTPKFIFNTLGKQLNLSENSPLVAQTRILHLSPQNCSKLGNDYLKHCMIINSFPSYLPL